MIGLAQVSNLLLFFPLGPALKGGFYTLKSPALFLSLYIRKNVNTQLHTPSDCIF
jgi:hypothetical protein